MLFGTSGLFVLARGRFPRGGGAVRGRTATWGGLAQRLIASYAVAVPAAMRRLGAALASDQTRVPAHFVCSGTMGRSLVKRRLRFRPVSQAWRLPAMLGVLGCLGYAISGLRCLPHTVDNLAWLLAQERRATLPVAPGSRGFQVLPPRICLVLVPECW